MICTMKIHHILASFIFVSSLSYLFVKFRIENRRYKQAHLSWIIFESPWKKIVVMFVQVEIPYSPDDYKE